MDEVQIKNHMHELKLYGMLDSLEVALDNTSHKTQALDLLNELLFAEVEARKIQFSQRLLKTSKLPHKVRGEAFDHHAKRSISKREMDRLQTLSWVKEQRSIIVEGPTGVGKTFLAQSLGHQCCQSRISTLFIDINIFLETLALERHSGRYLNYLRRLGRPQVLIFDDFGLRKFSQSESTDFCDILKFRSDRSTVITTQLPITHWSEIIDDEVLADTIIDRLKHTAIKIFIVVPLIVYENP